MFQPGEVFAFLTVEMLFNSDVYFFYIYVAVNELTFLQQMLKAGKGSSFHRIGTFRYFITLLS